MFPLAVAFFILYALGVPTLFWWQLRRHREVLHLPGPQWQLGLLYTDFKPEYWWFECIQLVRKLMLWYPLSLLCACIHAV